MSDETKPTALEDKITQLLTECRILLPGSQVFLGFQLSAFLTESSRSCRARTRSCI